MLLHLTNFEGPWNSTNGADQTPRSIVCLRGALHAAPEYADAMFNLALLLQRAKARLRGSSGRFKASIFRGARRYHRGWRVPLPRRKSTNPPANSCGREVTLPISNCSCN
jgi:hypothetical protein